MLMVVFFCDTFSSITLQICRQICRFGLNFEMLNNNKCVVFCFADSICICSACLSFVQLVCHLFSLSVICLFFYIIF